MALDAHSKQIEAALNVSKAVDGLIDHLSTSATLDAFEKDKLVTKAVEISQSLQLMVESVSVDTAAVLEAHVPHARESEADLRQQLDRAVQQLAELRVQGDEERQKGTSLSHERNRLQEQNSALQTELRLLHDKVQQERETVSSVLQERSQLQSEIGLLHVRVRQEETNANSSLLQERNQLQAQTATLQSEIEWLRSEALRGVGDRKDLLVMLETQKRELESTQLEHLAFKKCVLETENSLKKTIQSLESDLQQSTPPLIAEMEQQRRQNQIQLDNLRAQHTVRQRELENQVEGLKSKLSQRETEKLECMKAIKELSEKLSLHDRENLRLDASEAQFRQDILRRDSERVELESAHRLKETTWKLREDELLSQLSLMSKTVEEQDERLQKVDRQLASPLAHTTRRVNTLEAEKRETLSICQSLEQGAQVLQAELKTEKEKRGAMEEQLNEANSRLQAMSERCATEVSRVSSESQTLLSDINSLTQTLQHAAAGSRLLPGLSGRGTVNLESPEQRRARVQTEEQGVAALQSQVKESHVQEQLLRAELQLKTVELRELQAETSSASHDAALLQRDVHRISEQMRHSRAPASVSGFQLTAVSSCA